MLTGSGSDALMELIATGTCLGSQLSQDTMELPHDPHSALALSPCQ
jgi:hypothetical protein